MNTRDGDGVDAAMIERLDQMGAAARRAAATDARAGAASAALVDAVRARRRARVVRRWVVGGTGVLAAAAVLAAVISAMSVGTSPRGPGTAAGGIALGGAGDGREAPVVDLAPPARAAVGWDAGPRRRVIDAGSPAVVAEILR